MTSSSSATWGKPRYQPGGEVQREDQANTLPDGTGDVKVELKQVKEHLKRNGEKLLEEFANNIEPKLPLINKVKFTDDKVIKVAFTIFLICAVTLVATSLMVRHPIISSTFFTILTLTGGVSLAAIAFRGVNKFRKEKKPN